MVCFNYDGGDNDKEGIAGRRRRGGGRSTNYGVQQIRDGIPVQE